MTEPLNPSAAGVASALKNLRVRAGLTEDRLSGGGPAPDTLAGLDVVRQLIDTGEKTEQAIVHAVQQAAEKLEPTLSIVADVSLALGRGKPLDLIPDADLYAPDLGQRREALLKNWDRLHELRSARPGKVPTPRALRLEVEDTALTALAVALTNPVGSYVPAETAGSLVGTDHHEPSPGGQTPSVSPAEMRAFGAVLKNALESRGVSEEQVVSELSLPQAEIARWVAGTALPSQSEARALDEYLSGRGAIQNVVMGIRSKPVRSGRVSSPVLPSSAPTLLETFQKVVNALRDSLIRDDDGRARGWPHDLRKLSTTPTATSTAYGIKTMLAVEEYLAPDLTPVADSLNKMARPGGGYATRDQVEPRPEATAAVVDALHRIDGTAGFPEQLAMMERALGDFERSRPFILTTMLETSVQLAPRGNLTRLLIEALLAVRRPYEDLLLWPEKAEPLLLDPAPSTAHTARAVRALAKAYSARESEQLKDPLDQEVKDAVDQAVVWLLGPRDLTHASEVIERQLDEKAARPEKVYVRHFTAAWVVKALVSAGIPATHPSVSHAMTQIWNSYSGDPGGLWRWGNGDLPIWMTFDAVDALHMAALATPARPGRPAQ